MVRFSRNKRVVIGLSGGVDSSVAALLLKQKGYSLVGIFLKFGSAQEYKKERCCSNESEIRARAVAQKLEIPFYVIDARKEFKRKVVNYFLNECEKGRTPNPCVVCNKEIKFSLLFKKAFSFGGSFVATGHYARVKNGRLFMGRDKEKDQSYFLWQLKSNQIKHILLPLGDYTKIEVRKLAKRNGLPTADVSESQELCFIAGKTEDFLKRHLKSQSGDIVLKGNENKVVGRHSGIVFYTIGQRRGLNLPQGPYYVVEKDVKKNVLIVSNDSKDLMRKEFTAHSLNWLVQPIFPLYCKVKIRYKSDLVSAKILSVGRSRVVVSLFIPQRAITPGQSVVFYKRNEVLGGGIIG